MKKCIFLSTLLFYSLIASKLLWADSTKIITLKDGSQLAGEITSVQNEVYSVQTKNLGLLQINGANIASITTPSLDTDLPAPVFPIQPESSSSDAGQFKNQVQQLQGQFLTNPSFIADIQSITQDKEIMQLLSDPELLGIVSSYNPEKIKNDPKIQQLLQNPKIKKLIEKMQQQVLPAFPPSSPQ